MCEGRLMNPLNDELIAEKRRAQMEKDWVTFATLIQKKVKPFHVDIHQMYHPTTHAFFGSHTDNRSYGNVTWEGNGGSWLRGDREANVLDARLLDSTQLGTKRTVAAPLRGDGWLRGEHQDYKIAKQDEPGDGTVPHRSGVAPSAHCQSFLRVNVGHEPAYKYEEGAENLRACHFALRAIVKIAQGVQETSLRYE